MNIQHDNEVGELQQVVVHRPGAEVVRGDPEQGDPARLGSVFAQSVAAREHGLLQELLRAAGASVVELVDLLELALRQAPPEATADLLELACTIGAVPEVAPFLSALPTERLAWGLVHGITWDELEGAPMTLARLRARVHELEHWPLPPLPAMLFVRDTAFAVGDRLVVARASHASRQREPLLVRYALSYSGLLGDARLLFDVEDKLRARAFRSVEGGDVLVVAPGFLVIGCSERTRPESVERLAQDVLFPALPKLERVYAVLLPEGTGHLERVLAPIDHGLFLGAPSIVGGLRGYPGAPVARLARGRTAEIVARANLFDVLRDELGPQIRLVPCGGHDPFFQRREQETDGASALCLGPGRIAMWARNTATLEALAEEQGFSEVRLSVAQHPEQRRDLIQAGLGRPRVAFTFSGSELSRTSGGPRGFVLPLTRAHA